MDCFLRTVDDLLNGRLAKNFSTSSDADIHYDMAVLLRDHARQFDQGLIPCHRLLEVTLSPFIKLARWVSQASTPNTNSKRVADSLCASVGAGLSAILSVQVFQDSTGVVQPNFLGLKKRAEFVRALMKTTFPEVRKGMGGG